jgi:hypothetical protein
LPFQAYEATKARNTGAVVRTATHQVRGRRRLNFAPDRSQLTPGANFLCNSTTGCANLLWLLCSQ